MHIPVTPHPYLSRLFSDILLLLRLNWHCFCVKNNSYSKKHSIPLGLRVKLARMNDFIEIPFGKTKCFPILKDDVFYDVANGSWTIPSREWVEQNMTLTENGYTIDFIFDELFNYDVYIKLSVSALITVYLLFVASLFGVYKLVLSILESLV